MRRSVCGVTWAGVLILIGPRDRSGEDVARRWAEGVESPKCGLCCLRYSKSGLRLKLRTFVGNAVRVAKMKQLAHHGVVADRPFTIVVTSAAVGDEPSAPTVS